jgi:hypothetical protein
LKIGIADNDNDNDNIITADCGACKIVPVNIVRAYGTPLILNLGNMCDEWLVSRTSRFNPLDIVPE